MSTYRFRERTSAVAITQKTKDRFSKDIGHYGYIDDDKKKTEFQNFIESKFTQNQNNTTTEEDDDILSFPCPEEFLGDINSSCPVNMVISEKARMCPLGFPYKREEKEATLLNISFKNFINQYDDKSVDDLEITELLGFDFDNVNAIKDKLNDLIDKTSVLIKSDSNKEGINHNQVLAFLCNKLNVRFFDF